MKQKQNNKQNTWANNYIVRRVSMIRIERKGEENKVIHLCMFQNEAYGYDNKSIPRLWKLREENKRKQQHTQIKRKSRWLATIHDHHMEAVAVYWLHCVRRRSRHTAILLSVRLTYVRETTMKYDALRRTIPLNIHASQNENETLYKRCMFKKHVHLYCTRCRF